VEAKIASVKARQAAKEAKAKPEVRALVLAVKAIDKAVEAANANPSLARALESARAILGEQLVGLGVRLLERMAKAARRKRTAAA